MTLGHINNHHEQATIAGYAFHEVIFWGSIVLGAVVVGLIVREIVKNYSTKSSERKEQNK